MGAERPCREGRRGLRCEVTRDLAVRLSLLLNTPASCVKASAKKRGKGRYPTRWCLPVSHAGAGAASGPQPEEGPQDARQAPVWPVRVPPATLYEDADHEEPSPPPAPLPDEQLPAAPSPTAPPLHFPDSPEPIGSGALAPSSAHEDAGSGRRASLTDVDAVKFFLFLTLAAAWFALPPLIPALAAFAAAHPQLARFLAVAAILLAPLAVGWAVARLRQASVRGWGGVGAVGQEARRHVLQFKRSSNAQSPETEPLHLPHIPAGAGQAQVLRRQHRR